VKRSVRTFRWRHVGYDSSTDLCNMLQTVNTVYNITLQRSLIMHVVNEHHLRLNARIGELVRNARWKFTHRVYVREFLRCHHYEATTNTYGRGKMSTSVCVTGGSRLWGGGGQSGNTLPPPPVIRTSQYSHFERTCEHDKMFKNREIFKRKFCR